MVNHQGILDRIKKVVLAIEPSAKVYLYGSRVRGTINTESDWDLLILLNRDKVSNETEQKVTHALYDLEFEIGEVISPMVYSEREWNAKYSFTPYYASVMREGKQL